MSPRSSIEGYLKAHALTREKEPEKTPVEPFVTISREAGAGGHTIGQRLAEILNEQPTSMPWTVFDKQLVNIVIKEHNLPKEVSKYMTEAGVNAFADFVADLVGLHPASDVFIRKTNETILAIASMGNAVIIGRGANYVTRNVPGGVHVRLVASKVTRLRRLREYYELSQKQAAEKLKQIDEDRAEYVRDAMGKDVANVLGYDVVINTTHIGYDAAARLIAAQILSS
jgi:cytidylate kinase